MILAVFFMDKINGFMTLLNSGMLNRSQGDLLHGSERNIVESAADDLTVLCVQSDCPSILMPEHSMPGSAWYSRAAYEGLRSNVV